jgi:hypothetical protein
MYLFRGLLTVLFLFAVVGLISLVAWANDVRDDRMHTVTSNSLSPVFAGRGSDDCNSTEQLMTVQPGATLPVQRIRFWKDCATLDLTLPGGRTGHIILALVTSQCIPRSVISSTFR